MIITIDTAWKNDKDTSRVIQFYLDPEELSDNLDAFNSFSYIYDAETDEVEFSIVGLRNEVVNIYYTANERENSTIKQAENAGEITPIKNLAATIYFDEVNATPSSSPTYIVRIPAYGKLIREVYEDNKSSFGIILPEDYNPTLGSNFYKDLNDNSYVTKDTYEDYIRSTNIKGHPLDEVGRKQVQNDGYYKIIKSLRIKCNALEKGVDSDGNYYSSDRNVDGYSIYGIYTYDFYDSKKNLIRENVTEVTSNLNFYDLYDTKELAKIPGTNIPSIRVLPFPTDKESYSRTYVGRLYYEDFDGILRYIQSTNYITLERFSILNFGEEDGTPIYYEGGYPLYIIGPNAGDTISFSVQLEKDEEDNYPEINTHRSNPIIANFSNPKYRDLFKISDLDYNSDTGKLYVTIAAKFDNDEEDPWRPSYAKILPSLEITSVTIRGYSKNTSLEITYYVIQKSSKIGIIPQKYESEDSDVPISLKKENGKYIFPVSGGIGLKIGYLGISSEVDPYDKDIIRNWSIREDMTYTDENTGEMKMKERSYFFKSYSGAFEEKIVLITGAYDGRLPEFYIRDFVDRSDLWRQAIYESEVTVIPEVEYTDKIIDLGGGWSYTLETDTNYFIGSNLLYLFNETNKYYTQRFNLIFNPPPHTGPNYSNFKATINGFNLLGGTEGTPVTDEEGLTYTFWSNYETIYRKLYPNDTSRDVLDYDEKEENVKERWKKIPIVYDDQHIIVERIHQNGEPTVPLYIEISDDPSSYSINNGSAYLQVTVEDTGFPAFIETSDGEYIRMKTRGARPLFICTKEVSNPNDYLYINYGIPKVDPDTGEVVEGVRYCPRVVDITDSNIINSTYYDYYTGSSLVIAYKVRQLPFVDKYKSLVEVKNTSSNKKVVYIGFEDINQTDKTVKFDLIYPQEYQITTKDIERIPTQDPLRFSFRLIETSANYEYQEIRFYCGTEGIQPLKLLREDNTVFPENDGGSFSNLGYPEIDLPLKSNKFNVFCETYNELYPDWKSISAYDTFEYSAPNGNNIINLTEEDSIDFDENESYLQVDLRNNRGGTDFIDLIRTKTDDKTWWNDWRFFVYNKFTNRYSLYCSSGSPNFNITDVNNKAVKEIKLSKIGLYRLHISLKNVTSVNDSNLYLRISNPNIKLFTTTIDSNAFVQNDPDKLRKGKVHKGQQIPANTTNNDWIEADIQGSTVEVSRVLYLWYEGGDVDVKGRLEFKWVLNESGEGEEEYSKSVVLDQVLNRSMSSYDLSSFFKFHSYYKEDGTNKTYDTDLPFGDMNVGFPIHGGIPGRIEFDNETYPFKLSLTIKDDDIDFIENTFTCTIDSPLEGGRTAELTEKGCYIEDSFVKSTYSLKPETYDQTLPNSQCNLERKVWDIVFKGGVANGLTAYGKLYYDSPLKPSLFTLKSLGSVGRDSKTISGVSDNQENFLINAHESENPDNIDYGCNVNSLFYEYAPNNIQTISLESAPARVILDHSNLFGENINFITSAQTRNGSTTLSDTIDVLDTTNRNLSLNIGDTVFKAFEWNNILNKSFDIRLYNDSDLDESCTNIPLALLNCFGNSLDDDDRNVNWIDIAKMKLNLMISVPEGFSDYENMVSPINYPGTTSWFGIGQQFSNKIIVEPEEIQPSTANGKSGNPRFIIPMGRFTGTNHTIEISINYSYQGTNVLTSTRGSSFIYDVEVYEKDTTEPSLLGKRINGVTVGGSSTRKISISLGNIEITKDIVLVPKFTNIEHNCSSEFSSIASTYTGGQNLNFKEFKRLKILNNTLTEINSGSWSIPTTSQNTTNIDFIGFKITEGYGVRSILDEKGLLSSSNNFRSLIDYCVNGLKVNLTLTIDNDSNSAEEVLLTRLGYGGVVLIQPGHAYEYDFNTEQSNQSAFYRIWFSWYNRNLDPDYRWLKGNQVGSKFDRRSLYVLFPKEDMTRVIKFESPTHPGTGNDRLYFKEEIKVQTLIYSGYNNTSIGGDGVPYDVRKPTDQNLVDNFTNSIVLKQKNQVSTTVSGNNLTPADTESSISIIDGERMPTVVYPHLVEIGQGENSCRVVKKYTNSNQDKEIFTLIYYN